MAKIFTIGHSNHKWNDFISSLKDKHVDTVVDVRRYPGSRACPQFNKGQMIIELKKENISYMHIEKLGGRRKQSDTKRSRYDDNNSGWKNEAFRAYADYMATTSFREGISEVLSLMTNYNNLAVMCSEAVPWRCHRRMIADYLTLVEGISVFDIIDSKQQPEPHQLTSFAQLTDSKITIIYPEKTNKSTNK
jgi:uncharacterized protein (DUF488 family)